MEDLFIIVGLGNPGSRYEETRHNVGFKAMDELAGRHGVKLSKLKHQALFGEGNIGGCRVILSKPQTFMNLSGESVRDMAEWYKIPLSNLILIYDDIDVELGKIRVRAKGSSGTHNGMRSVLYHIQSESFPRVRIGIGRPPQGWDLADFVLGRFGEEEAKTIGDSIKTAADAVEAVVTSGIEAAMNKFNR